VATFYLRSTDGSDSDDGSTWALAKATATGVGSASTTAGDTTYLSPVHAESTASSITINFRSGSTTPWRFVCADDSANPPTAVATGANITTTGTASITFNTGGDGNGGYAYAYGVTFNAGTGAGISSINIGSTSGSGSTFSFLEKCNFNLLGTASSALINIGSGGAYLNARLVDCTFSFGATGQHIKASGTTRIHGGSIAAGSSAITTVFEVQNGSLEVIGCDLSHAATAASLVNPNAGSNTTVSYARLVGCKLPASWSGNLVTTTPNGFNYAEMINCDAGATNYRYWRETQFGSIKHETTIVRSGGASDGTTPLSWKLASNTRPRFPNELLESQDILAWNDTVGSSVTATVEIVTDNVTLNDDEAFLQVFYYGSSSTPLATRISDAKADILASASAQTTSSATWTTTGLGTPVKQKLSVTFTPQMKGFVIARVMLAKASTTVYVDPVLTLA